MYRIKPIYNISSSNKGHLIKAEHSSCKSKHFIAHLPEIRIVLKIDIKEQRFYWLLQVGYSNLFVVLQFSLTKISFIVFFFFPTYPGTLNLGIWLFWTCVFLSCYLKYSSQIVVTIFTLVKSFLLTNYLNRNKQIKSWNSPCIFINWIFGFASRIMQTIYVNFLDKCSDSKIHLWAIH
jgi:hypothetical protein